MLMPTEVWSVGGWVCVRHLVHVSRHALCVGCCALYDELTEQRATALEIVTESFNHVLQFDV